MVTRNSTPAYRLLSCQNICLCILEASSHAGFRRCGASAASLEGAPTYEEEPV